MNVSELLIAVVMRLRSKLSALHVNFFPERLEEFCFNHPMGAVLVSYSKSTFGKMQDVGVAVQPETVRLNATAVLRQLNGKGGAVDVLTFETVTVFVQDSESADLPLLTQVKYEDSDEIHLQRPSKRGDAALRLRGSAAGDPAVS